MKPKKEKFTFLSTAILVCCFGLGASFMVFDAANRVTTLSVVFCVFVLSSETRLKRITFSVDMLL